MCWLSTPSKASHQCQDGLSTTAPIALACKATHIPSPDSRAENQALPGSWLCYLRLGSRPSQRVWCFGPATFTVQQGERAADGSPVLAPEAAHHSFHPETLKKELGGEGSSHPHSQGGLVVGSLSPPNPKAQQGKLSGVLNWQMMLHLKTEVLPVTTCAPKPCRNFTHPICLCLFARYSMVEQTRI